MAEPKIEHVHFDMDGVIANTEPIHVEAELMTCRRNGFVIDENDWTGFKGRTAEAIFTTLIERYGDPSVHSVEELIKQKTDGFIEIASESLAPIEGVVDFMQWIKGQTQTMNLVTSSNRQVQEFIIESFGVRHLLDQIVTGDDIQKGKPDPEPYLLANRLVMAAPEKTLVIEDSMSGIASAVGAGCVTLAIATSHSVEELIEADTGATFICADYADARRQLVSHFGL